jgi:hypothetical protein
MAVNTIIREIKGKRKIKRIKLVYTARFLLINQFNGQKNEK